MYKIKYEKYYNDHNTSFEEKNFSSLSEAADWFFSLAYGEYKKCMSFLNPDMDYNCNGRFSLPHGAISAFDGKYTYWIRLIEKDGGVIFSTGGFTNGICHWNEESKAWIRLLRERLNRPVINFI